MNSFQFGPSPWWLFVQTYEAKEIHTYPRTRQSLCVTKTGLRNPPEPGETPGNGSRGLPAAHDPCHVLRAPTGGGASRRSRPPSSGLRGTPGLSPPRSRSPSLVSLPCSRGLPGKTHAAGPENSLDRGRLPVDGERPRCLTLRRGCLGGSMNEADGLG